MLVQASDLSTAARIRNAALEQFAASGVEATSIADVARAAGVSPGLVQHYFHTKAGLRDAVNAYLLAVARQAFGELLGSGAAADSFREAGDRITALVREHRVAVLYLARSVAEEEPAALELFDAFVAIGLTQLRHLAESGELDPDVDFDWMALHLVTNAIGTVFFEAAVNRHLSEPLATPAGLDRWNAANTRLFQRGLGNPARGSRTR